MRGGLTSYAVVPASSLIVARVRSTLHDAQLRWQSLSGELELDGGQLTSATLEVDMRAFSSGDRMLDWKIRGDLTPDRWPTARFTMDGSEGTVGGAMAVRGTLDWRDRQVRVEARGPTTCEASGLTARVTFSLDMRDLGIKPPRLLLLKAEPVVAVEVLVVAGVHGT